MTTYCSECRFRRDGYSAHECGKFPIWEERDLVTGDYPPWLDYKKCRSINNGKCPHWKYKQVPFKEPRASWWRKMRLYWLGRL